MGRYIEKDDPQAERLWEHFIGHSFAWSMVTEEHTFHRNRGNQIQINGDPEEIAKVEGHLVFRPLHIDTWVQIPLDHITRMGRVLDIPGSTFQSQYNRVRVHYYRGEKVIPEDMQAAVNEISRLLEQEGVGAWNLPLSPETLSTIEKYKQKTEGWD